MDHIGNIIYAYRNKLAMSRSDLSAGICSEKFIYMIEKSQRKPSAAMISQLGDRLGVNLFEYNGYSQCADPLITRQYMDEFDLYRRESDLKALQALTEKAKIMPDFQLVPWIYEIEISELSIALFLQFQIEEVIEKSFQLIKRIKRECDDQLYLVHTYSLLSIAYQMAKDIPRAVSMVEIASNLTKGKEKIKKYDTAIGSLWIARMALYNMSGQWDKAIIEGNRFAEFQNNIGMKPRMYFIYFYLAYAYYLKGAEYEAVEWFEKGLHLVLVKEQSQDVLHLLYHDTFHKILNDPRISALLRNEFKNKYDL